MALGLQNMHQSQIHKIHSPLESGMNESELHAQPNIYACPAGGNCSGSLH